MQSEEKHFTGLVCGGVPGGGVLGLNRASAVCHGCGADGDAGGVGLLVSSVGSVVIGSVLVSGFLGVLLIWLFLFS